MSSLRTAVLVLSVVIARAEFEDLLLLQDPPVAPAPAPAPGPGPVMPDDPLCPQFQNNLDPADGRNLPVCQDAYRDCLNDGDCGALLVEFQNPENTVCSLDAAIGPCLASRNVSLDSPTFALGVDIAMCVLCCNDGGYRPASFNDSNGQMIESECTCRLPAEEAPEAAECYIPFFWDGAWQTDCVEIDGADFCGGTLQPADMSQLLPCAPFDEAQSDQCTFPSVTQTGTTAPNPDTTDDAPVQGVGTLAVSSFVALLTVVGSLVLVN